MHNIEIRTINGIEVPSFVENGSKEIAWHGLGERVNDCLTAADALKKAHADYEVAAQPIVALTPEMMLKIETGIGLTPDEVKNMIIEGQRATMRTDYNETLGIVSDNYGIVQNKDAFDFIDLLTTGEFGGSTPVIECAGVLGKGERIFITARFPENFQIDGKEDIINNYAVFTTSHDGMGAVSCMITPIRVVCQNTLNIAFHKNNGKLSFRHTKYVNERMDLLNKENAKNAYRTLNLYQTYTEVFKEKLAALAAKRLTDNEVKDIVAKTMLSEDAYKIFKLSDFGINSDEISTRSRNLVENMTATLYQGVGQNILEPNTGIWLINGISTYYQNTANFKDNTKKFESIMEGHAQNKLQTAYDAVMAA